LTSLLLLILLPGIVLLFWSSRSATPASPGSILALPVKVDAAGLPNVYHVADRLYSGGSPEGDEGFASLQKLGIRTIISVDGSRPDIELARKYQLRYVHLPIGYDGVNQEQALKIARAIRDLPGPIYLHCHHGKHRSPAAAAAALVCLDSRCPVKSAVNVMKQAGTDPHYSGLYAAPAKLHPATKEELDRAPADFPQVAYIPDLARLMVEIDDRWDRIKRARTAGWKTPRNHPDIDPPHEVLQLQEGYREAGRLSEGQLKQSKELLRWLHDAAEGARELEEALRGKKPTAELDRLFHGAGAACTRCHAKYRDVPQE
jgi:protein tyrosine phosphatase (PTP) superfamily phosphohydrolase (DUF442 family)